MANYGGLGGIAEGRPLDEDDAFEMMISRVLGERLRKDTGLCKRLWGSLANVDWKHENGDTAGYSFRAAGDLVAAVIGRGHYMDWYCSHDYGKADDEIAGILAEHGWTWEETPLPPLR